MTNITMLIHGRPRLTEQALRTLRENTPADIYTLTTFDDEGKMGTGPARNEVICRAETSYGRGEYLYLSDCDVAFTPRWLEFLCAAYEHGEEHFRLAAIGGYCHPYHQPFESHSWSVWRNDPHTLFKIGLTYALPTQSMLLRWGTWLKYGPFLETPPGKVGQSEDWNFTERLRTDGLRVGAIYPHVVINTGRHDSFGNLAIGHELVEDVPGLIIE